MQSFFGQKLLHDAVPFESTRFSCLPAFTLHPRDIFDAVRSFLPLGPCKGLPPLTIKCIERGGREGRRGGVLGEKETAADRAGVPRSRREGK